jgi:beta-galactosidase
MNMNKFDTTYFLHGGDYNPDQWLAYPDILKEDARLMSLAKVNTLSVGIFAWSALEPEEHRYTFDWLDETFERMHGIGMKIILATPGGARPPWMAQKYPEVMRMEADRKQPLFGGRHNHCPTSTVYREKCVEMNTLLAERYGRHPALLMWHVNNEYLGRCHCPRCEQAFREWLRRKYGTLKALNAAWWSHFWSMRFSDWSQIEAPAPHGQTSFNALRIDYKRFMSDQVIDFFKTESAPLRAITPEIPVTTNFHEGGFLDYNAWHFAREVDVVSWDNYPRWHQDRTRAMPPLNTGATPEEADDGSGLDVQSEYRSALEAAARFDMMRSLKGGEPFLMLESAPGMAQWFWHPSQKEKGLPLLSALQAVAHGSQSVMYFQWRKGRGNFEKFHGAVVDHAGHEHTQTFREVAETGECLERLAPLVATRAHAEAAILFDPDNTFALEEINGIHNVLFCRHDSGYWREVLDYYRALVECGVTVDFVAPDQAYDGYKLVVAPVCYMCSDETGRRLKEMVQGGGSLITTYWSGIVDENDQCHLGGFPGPLREVTGVWAEEYNALAPHRSVDMEWASGAVPGLEGVARIRTVAEGLQLQGAEALATFTSGRYEGQPAVTRNRFGEGRAYYLGAKLPHPHLKTLLAEALKQAGVQRIHDFEVPTGVYVTQRSGACQDYLFVMNFTDEAKTIGLDRELDMIWPEERKMSERYSVPPFGLIVLR